MYTIDLFEIIDLIRHASGSILILRALQSISISRDFLPTLQ